MKNSGGNVKGHRFRLPVLLTTALLCGVGIATADAAGTVTRQISKAGTVTLRNAGAGVDGIQYPEFAPALRGLGFADSPRANSSGVQGVAGKAPALSKRGGRVTNRSFARGTGVGESVESSQQASHHPTLELSFDGLNHRQQRLASDGNQFSLEPPDQGLCVGNGYVLETVNSVMRVFDTSGKALTDPIALNAFYGYRPAYDRTNVVFGPLIADPSCYFDHQTRRWFHLALTLDTDPKTGDSTGTNHLDLAVSTTANPRGAWNIYRFPAQNDGTDSTPDHGCSAGKDDNGQPTGHGPCIGDYPHIGADAYGIYLTTNEYSFFGPEFKSAQIYAISKKALTQGALSVTVVHIDTIDHLLDGNPGFTVWPAMSPGGGFNGASRGTEFFLSSVAVFNDSNTDHRLRIWALTNTRSLETNRPNLFFTHNVVNVASYAVPPLSNQKPGNIPLADCINDTTLDTPSGPGCWRNLLDDEPAHNEVLSPLDSNDSRIQQVVYSGGKLYAALDTAITLRDQEQAGIAYYVLQPFVFGGSVFGFVHRQGKIGLANNNLTYPAIAALPNGKAVVAFTLVGADHHPSAAYVTIDEWYGAGPIHVVAEGVGPQDGFSGYAAFSAPDPASPRWGDYGAAVADGNSIWIASEYINQTCTFAAYTAAPFGSCGGTRSALGNWSTRISRVEP